MKLLIFLGYYFVTYFITIIAGGVFLRDISTSASDVVEYILCELNGHDPNDPCDDSVLHQPASVGLAVLLLLYNGVASIINLMFVVNIQELKEKCGRCYEMTRLATRSTK